MAHYQEECYFDAKVIILSQTLLLIRCHFPLYLRTYIHSDPVTLVATRPTEQDGCDPSRVVEKAAPTLLVYVMLERPAGNDVLKMACHAVRKA